MKKTIFLILTVLISATILALGGCRASTTSSAIPTSFATLVKTIQPGATLIIQSPELSPTASPSETIEAEMTADIPEPLETPGPTATAGPTAVPATQTARPDVQAGTIDEGLSTMKYAYFLNAGSTELTAQTFVAGSEDESAVFVSNGASLTLHRPRITKTGSTSSEANSKAYGLNAAALVRAKSSLRIDGGAISTNALGAAGVAALSAETKLTLQSGSIETSNRLSPGVFTGGGAASQLTEVQISTSGVESPGLKVGHGAGTLTVRAGRVASSGQGSHCFVSMGTSFIDGTSCTASAAGVAVVDGVSTLALRNVVANAAAPEYGVLLYRSGEAAALTGNTSFSAEGGSLTTLNNQAPLFLASNTNAQITLKDLKVELPSSLLLRAEADERWGEPGYNGATVSLILEKVLLTGRIVADELSSVNISMVNNAVLTGAINTDHKALFISLSMDPSSSWTLTGNSYVNRLQGVTVSGNTVSGIVGNGFTLLYDPIQSPSLGGNTYSLAGGGSLAPAN